MGEGPHSKRKQRPAAAAQSRSPFMKLRQGNRGTLDSEEALEGTEGNALEGVASAPSGRGQRAVRGARPLGLPRSLSSVAFRPVSRI